MITVIDMLVNVKRYLLLYVCIIFLVLPSGALAKELKYTKPFEKTNDLYTYLQSYQNELVILSEDYLQREDRLFFEDLAVQVIPVLRAYVNDAMHQVWTLNRLMYIESFHERMDQYSENVQNAISDYIERTIASVQDDLAMLNKVVGTIPSISEVAMLMNHYHRTVSCLEKTLALLHEIDIYLKTFESVQKSEQIGEVVL